MCNLLSAFNFSEIFSNIVSRWYYYVILLVAVVGVILYKVLHEKQQVVLLGETKRITYTGILTALCTLANILCFYVYIPARCAVSFIAVPCFIAGYLLGAGTGFAVGFLGDLLGVIIAPAGAYLPFIGIASGLWGFIPGFIFNNFKGNKYVKLIISFVICFVVCSAGLNTLANWLYVVLDMNSTTTFITYLLTRVWFQAVITVANGLICASLMFTLETVKKKYVKADKNIENDA